MLPSLMSAPPHLWGCVCTHLCSVSLGVVPSGSALQGLPTFYLAKGAQEQSGWMRRRTAGMIHLQYGQQGR